METGKQRGSPPSVTAIIDERLARLSNEALLVLQACAVLDVNATIERVEGVLEYQSHVLLSAVQELSVAGMLRAEAQTSPDSGEPLTVGHDLISTAALDRLARAPLAFLHRRAGTVLERETLGDGARTAILWACAFHWQHAGDRERAFRAACSCAEHLLDVGLPSDAAQAFERVLDYCVTDEQRLLVLSRLAISLQMSGQWEESKGVLLKSRELQRKITPGENTHDDVELALFEARWRAGLEYSSLLKELKACAESNDASVTHRVMCGLLGLKIATGDDRSDVVEAFYLTIRPLLENPTITGNSPRGRKWCITPPPGTWERAKKLPINCLRKSGTRPDARVRARALSNVGFALRRVGRSEDAERVLVELVDYSIVHGLPHRASCGLLLLALIRLTAGDLPRARDSIQKLQALSRIDQDHFLVADELFVSARLALEEGNLEEAAEKYELLAAHTGPNESIVRQGVVLAVEIRIQNSTACVD